MDVGYFGCHSRFKLALRVCFLGISALFAMEINVTKNLLTGEKTVVSTATVPAEDLKHHAGLKVYDDGRKCVYALNSEEVTSGEHTSMTHWAV